MTATPPIPRIPFPVVLADGSRAQVHVGRQYELAYRTAADASQDFELRGGLRVIEHTAYGPRLVFNGSPRFGDKGVLARQILRITEASGHGISFLRGIPRGTAAAASQDAYEIRLAGDSITSALAGQVPELMYAVTAARDRGHITWITTGAAGQYMCAIVPVAVAEHHEAAADLVTAVLDAPAGPDLTARLALVIAQLIRTGTLNPRHIGLPHLDSAAAGHAEILGGVEAWLREGPVP